MTLAILIFFLSFSTPITFESQVILKDGSSICKIIYSIPKETKNWNIQYKKIEEESWTTSQLDSFKGNKTISSLNPDQLYEVRISWTSLSGEKLTSDLHYFRTFGQLSKAAPDFGNYKVIIPKTEKDFQIHLLRQGKLSFSYKDQYRKTGNLKGEVYNAENVLAARFYTEKAADGLYHIDLLKLNYQWSEGEIYSIKVFDDKNVAKWMFFSFEKVNDKIDISITSTAIHIDCDPENNSIINYSAIVNGGSLPYDIIWTISNLNGGEVIYGPSKSQIIRNDETSSATIELPIPYMITLSAFDGCGLFAETSLLVTCSDDSDSDNVLLFEKIKTPTNGRN